jgi:hypothetical protein
LIFSAISVVEPLGGTAAGSESGPTEIATLRLPFFKDKFAPTLRTFVLDIQLNFTFRLSNESGREYDKPFQLRQAAKTENYFAGAMKIP